MSDDVENMVPDVAKSKCKARKLNAKVALAILLVYGVVQCLSFFGMQPIASAIAAKQGIHNPQQINLLFNVLAPFGTFAGFVFGGIAVVLVAKFLVPASLKDTGSHGAAWVTGSFDGIKDGLIIGGVIGVLNQASGFLIKHHAVYNHSDIINRMSLTPGLVQIMWIITALVLAPLSEEMLYRGVLYGGFRNSFGSTGAAVIVSLMFVIIHSDNYLDNRFNMIFIVVTTIVTLWGRLHWKAIGPAVAIHFGYNFIVVLFTLYKTRR